MIIGARGDSSSLICEKSEAGNETYKESYPQDVEKDLVKSWKQVLKRLLHSRFKKDSSIVIHNFVDNKGKMVDKFEHCEKTRKGESV